MKRLLYKPWIREQAALYAVDGCTGVTNWNAICCLIHDLEFKFAKVAASAYQHYLNGHPDPWAAADPTTFEECNARFEACNFREGKFGYWNPLAWFRYAGMRLRKTRTAWDEKRAKDTQPA